MGFDRQLGNGVTFIINTPTRTGGFDDLPDLLAKQYMG